MYIFQIYTLLLLFNKKCSLCYKLISISPYAVEFHLSEFCIEISFKEGGDERERKEFLQDQPAEIKKKKKIFFHAFHKFEISSPCITSYTRYKESIKISRSINLKSTMESRPDSGPRSEKIHWLLFQKRHSIT